MWPRVIEFMLGCWLVMSPFIFQHAVDQKALWFNDLFCGFAIAILALLSFWSPLRRAHLVIAGIALWLIGFGYLMSPYPAPPALQNDILVGLLLLMFAIIPTESSLPPLSWREYFLEETETTVQAEKGQTRQRGLC